MVAAKPAPDNYHVSELINVSVAAVLIDENHVPVPMVVVPSDVIIIARMTATARGRALTSQQERSEDQGGRYRCCGSVRQFHINKIALSRFMHRAGKVTALSLLAPLQSSGHR